MRKQHRLHIKLRISGLVVRGTTRTDWNTLVNWVTLPNHNEPAPRLLAQSIGKVGPPDPSTLHPSSAESSEFAHSARPFSNRARSSSCEMLARRAKFQRRGSARRNTIRLTRSPGRRAKCSTGRRTPFSYSASTSLTARIVTLALGGKMPACNSVQGSTAFVATLASRAMSNLQVVHSNSRAGVESHSLRHFRINRLQAAACNGVTLLQSAIYVVQSLKLVSK